jgi:hypothetical protein
MLIDCIGLQKSTTTRTSDFIVHMIAIVATLASKKVALSRIGRNAYEKT